MDQQWKKDRDKVPVELLPPKAMLEVAMVLGHGAKKYEADSWRKVDTPLPRYYASALRHMLKWAEGEIYDQDSGLSHLAHAATNLLFMVELEGGDIETRAKGDSNS